ncbi:50S ribosomal protein L9 [Candidatus Kaiserbacteria bacterium]|nr:50S ribosomal protein L9 [Candidatus Kaiserbacteria bacterium]
MKVILLRDVAKIGKRFEVVEVPTGHAQNFLIPHKHAEPATPGNVRRVMAHKAKQAHDTEAHALAFAEALTQLAEQKVVLTVEANEQGHLFKGVKGDMIAACLKEAGVSVPVEAVRLDEPIKTLGEHTITLALGDHAGSFVLSVVAA